METRTPITGAGMGAVGPMGGAGAAPVAPQGERGSHRPDLTELNQRAVAFIKDRPGTALVIAAGLGYLVGRIVRS